MIKDICKWFHCTPDVAQEQDVNLCQRIMSMDAFDELASMEKRNAKALNSEQRSWLIRLERAAGIQ